MPCLRRASWQFRLQPRMPNLAALYTGNPATGSRAALEPMLMMVPAFFSTWRRKCTLLSEHRNGCCAASLMNSAVHEFLCCRNGGNL